MPSAQAFTAANNLVGAADHTGEGMARSSLDMAAPPAVPPSQSSPAAPPAPSASSPEPPIHVPTSPQDFLTQSLAVDKTAQGQFDVAGALAKMNADNAAAAAAPAILAEQYKQDALKKVPIDQMNAEINRLNMAKLRVLPDMLARTDITDFRVKQQLASQLQAQFDNSIADLSSTKQSITTAAESNATLRVQAQEAKNTALKDQFDRDQKAYSDAIAGAKDSATGFHSILQATLRLQESQDKLHKATGSGIGLGLGTDPTKFSPTEVDLFLEWEANNKDPTKIPVASSATHQDKAQFLARYSQWFSANRPGIQQVMLPAVPGWFGTSFGGTPAHMGPAPNPFADLKTKDPVTTPVDTSQLPAPN